MDDDDDDDMGTPPMEEPMPREHSLPPHLQNPSSYMRTASPPVANGVPYPPRQHTPQAQMISRPGSRNSGVTTVRRPSTNLGPSQLQQVSQAPQGQNGYAYMRTPPMHNYQAAHGMPVAPHHPQQPAPQPQYYNQHPPQPAATHPQVQQVFMQDHQRRQSLPPAFPQHERQQQQQQNMPSPPQPDREHQTQDDQSNRLQKPAQTKSRSIFTPIDDSRSMLAQGWGIGKSTNEPKAEIKRERDTQPEIQQNPQISNPPPPPPPRSQKELPAPKRTNSTEFPPPSRTSTTQSSAQRPRLKVQIPEEQSDAEEATGESSPQQSGATPAKGSTDASHSSGTGVVLPPPSPSASAILSAGASGPPNPFARPHPPAQQNSQSYNSNNNMDTPMSALPSRFVADGLLPSPSSFYPEWGFGRSGGESNMLPSPINFPTPVMAGASFRDEDRERKRKSPEQDGQEAKRVKT